MFMMNNGGASGRNRWWWPFLVLSAGLLGGSLLRYLVLENVTQAQFCQVDARQLICQFRSALGWSIHFQLFGKGALVLALLAWLPPLRRLAWPALLLSAGGLPLYNTTYAAVALIVALLAVLHE